jgi:hypothetical protein
MKSDLTCRPATITALRAQEYGSWRYCSVVPRVPAAGKAATGVAHSGLPSDEGSLADAAGTWAATLSSEVRRIILRSDVASNFVLFGGVSFC